MVVPAPRATPAPRNRSARRVSLPRSAGRRETGSPAERNSFLMCVAADLPPASSASCCYACGVHTHCSSGFSPPYSICTLRTTSDTLKITTTFRLQLTNKTHCSSGFSPPFRAIAPRPGPELQGDARALGALAAPGSPEHEHHGRLTLLRSGGGAAGDRRSIRKALLFRVPLAYVQDSFRLVKARLGVVVLRSGQGCGRPGAGREKPWEGGVRPNTLPYAP